MSNEMLDCQTPNMQPPISSPKHWLELWDALLPVPTISMGGLGDAYEQAIQEMAFESLREMLAYIGDAKEWPNLEQFNAHLRKWRLTAFDKWHPTGAMVAAATNLAWVICKRGMGAMLDPEVQPRLMVTWKGRAV